MKTLIAAIGSLIRDAADRDEGLLYIYTGGSKGRDVRMQFSEAKHPDLEYERMPHDDVFDQMVAHYGGVEVFYLTDKDE